MLPVAFSSLQTLPERPKTKKLRLRLQLFTTIGHRLRECRKALHSGECVWGGPFNRVKLTPCAAGILAFAEELSVRVASAAAVISACPTRVKQEVSSKKCPGRVSYKSVESDCLTRRSSKCVLQECQVRSVT